MKRYEMSSQLYIAESGGVGVDINAASLDDICNDLDARDHEWVLAEEVEVLLRRAAGAIELANEVAGDRFLSLSATDRRQIMEQGDAVIADIHEALKED